MSQLWYRGENRAADGIVVCRCDGREFLLVVVRQDGLFALPGGFVDDNEKGRKAAEMAARREVLEETSLRIRKKPVFIGYYTDSDRDPRSTGSDRVSTQVFFYDIGTVKKLPKVTHKYDRDGGLRGVAWFPLSEVIYLKFFADHADILRDFLQVYLGCDDDVLFDIRRFFGMSQKEFAKIFDINHSTLSNYENGRRVPVIIWAVLDRLWQCFVPLRPDLYSYVQMKLFACGLAVKDRSAAIEKIMRKFEVQVNKK